MNEITDVDPVKYAIRSMAKSVESNSSTLIAGTVTRVSGMKIEAIGLSVPLNTLCEIFVTSKKSINAEVIGFSDQITYLMANENIDGIHQGALVVPSPTTRCAKVGMGLLGRIIDATGHPIDGRGDILTDDSYPLTPKLINPLARKKISEPLNVGIKAINGLFTIGKGQRIGIFAGSGVGKSVLLGMMTRFTSADIVVVGLIGERGREVKEFIEENLGEEGLRKAIVVASPADTSPLMRVNGAVLANTIAEYYRDQGLDVLLIIDSLTRYAQAQREISLSVGEFPATKGFTPSVFAKLSQIVERSGNGANGQGSITAFYTVLVEGEDYHDPIADHVKSVLDGHIVLSRQLAGSGHYPAIDIDKSISRVMIAVTDDKHNLRAAYFKKLYSTYIQNRELVNVGMYQHGSDRLLDEAIKHKDHFENYLRQTINESYNLDESIRQLYTLFAE